MEPGGGYDAMGDKKVEYLSVRQVVQELKIHPNTVYAMLETGAAFPHAFKLLKDWRIPSRDVRAFRIGFVMRYRESSS
jgi:predicted DNA-binding transcriptional regulator AlpA